MARKPLADEKVAMDAPAWNACIAALPGAHVLQTGEWGQVKAQYGWKPLPQVWRDEHGNASAAALVLERTLPVGGFAARLRIHYAPKGPLLDWGNPSLRHRVLDGLADLARRRGAIFIKIDPDVPLGYGVPGEPDARENATGQDVLRELLGRGWILSDEQVQFRNTVLIDLRPDEETLLANMKQKTRYNVRLAERKGVCVRQGTLADLDLLYRMYAETSLRDGFVIRERDYYLNLWSVFMQGNGAPLAQPLIAEVDGQPVAAVVLFVFAGTAWYLNGMSSELHREKMPNYLLQWEAIRWSRSIGCHTYNLWGAPDVFNETDSLWGVFRFKEGLGGRVLRTIGAWDLPIRPWVYRLYSQILPRLLDRMRRRGTARVQRSLG